MYEFLCEKKCQKTPHLICTQDWIYFKSGRWQVNEKNGTLFHVRISWKRHEYRKRGLWHDMIMILVQCAVVLSRDKLSETVSSTCYCIPEWCVLKFYLNAVKPLLFVSDIHIWKESMFFFSWTYHHHLLHVIVFQKDKEHKSPQYETSSQVKQNINQYTPNFSYRFILRKKTIVVCFLFGYLCEKLITCIILTIN